MYNQQGGIVYDSFLSHIPLTPQYPVRPKSAMHGLWMLSGITLMIFLNRQLILCVWAQNKFSSRSKFQIWTPVCHDGQSTLSGRGWGYLPTIKGLDLSISKWQIQLLSQEHMGLVYLTVCKQCLRISKNYVIKLHLPNSTLWGFFISTADDGFWQVHQIYLSSLKLCV